MNCQVFVFGVSENVQRQIVSHCPTLGWAMFLKQQQQHVAQCVKHPLYIGHICTGHVPICPMSSVQCPMYIANIVLHCKQCPTLQTLSYIADIVLHWSLSVLKNRTTTCDPLLHQQPIPVEGGSHSLPAKPLSDIFETFWISSSSQYVWEMFKIPQKCLTRIIQHVTRFSWLWASIFWDGVVLRLAGLQMVFIQSKPVCSEETIRESLVSGKQWMRAPPSYDSMFKYWLW